MNNKIVKILDKIIQKVKDPYLPTSSELTTKVLQAIIEGNTVYRYNKITSIYKFGIGRRIFGIGRRIFGISATSKDGKFLMMITCTKGLFVYTWGRNSQSVFHLGDPELVTKMEEAIDYAR
jgi:hypothetical protein